MSTPGTSTRSRAWRHIARALLVGVLGLAGLFIGLYCLWGLFASNISWTSSLEPPDYSTPSEATFAVGALICAAVPPAVAALVYPSGRRWLLLAGAVLLLAVGGLIAYIHQMQ